MYKRIRKIIREKLQLTSGGFNLKNIPAIQKLNKLEVDSLLVVKISDFYHCLSVCASGSSSKARGV
jgi:acyl carrier protein